MEAECPTRNISEYKSPSSATFNNDDLLEIGGIPDACAIITRSYLPPGFTSSGGSWPETTTATSNFLDLASRFSLQTFPDFGRSARSLSEPGREYRLRSGSGRED